MHILAYSFVGSNPGNAILADSPLWGMRLNPLVRFSSQL
jgi:hypothetical protein